MLKINFEDTVASPPGPFGWCPLYGTMLGPQCLLLTQLRIKLAPQIVSIILKLIGPCAVIDIVLSFCDSPFYHLGDSLADGIPSMFPRIVDARS